MALLLSIMGVRALGETDLNPVSGISKLAQLFFALIIPQGHKSIVLINLVAGAVVSLICQSFDSQCANSLISLKRYAHVHPWMLRGPSKLTIQQGALQAGELMQDLKTGHLLGAAPRAQFWGQVIGATAGAVTSAFIYKIYTSWVTSPDPSVKRGRLTYPTGSTPSRGTFSQFPRDTYGYSPRGW